jgi:hypothetical protein
LEFQKPTIKSTESVIMGFEKGSGPEGHQTVECGRGSTERNRKFIGFEKGNERRSFEILECVFGF